MFYEVVFDCIDVGNDNVGILVGDGDIDEQLLIVFEDVKDVIKE